MWCRGRASLGGCGGSGGGEGSSLAIGGRGRSGVIGFHPALLGVGIITTAFAVRDTAVGEEGEARGERTGEHGG